jgi:hypothetical protein
MAWAAWVSGRIRVEHPRSRTLEYGRNDGQAHQDQANKIILLVILVAFTPSATLLSHNHWKFAKWSILRTLAAYGFPGRRELLVLFCH